MKTKKRNIVICIVLLVIIIGSVILGIKLYKAEEEKYIQSCINEINDTYKSFEIEESRTKKLDILEALINEFEDYKELEKNYEAVTEVYKKTINLMKSYFKDYYDEVLAQNTIKNVGEVSDKGELTEFVAELEKLRDEIKSEKNITLTKEEAKIYTGSIDNLIDLYNERVKAIKAEEERIAKEKAEAERAAQEAARKAQAEEKNKSSNKDINQATDSKNNPKNNPNLQYKWYKDEDGKLLFEGYVDGYGRVYDMDGNDVSW